MKDKFSLIDLMVIGAAEWALYADRGDKENALKEMSSIMKRMISEECPQVFLTNFSSQRL